MKRPNKPSRDLALSVAAQVLAGLILLILAYVLHLLPVDPATHRPAASAKRDDALRRDVAAAPIRVGHSRQVGQGGGSSHSFSPP
jgi:hypothetical protein